MPLLDDDISRTTELDLDTSCEPKESRNPLVSPLR